MSRQHLDRACKNKPKYPKAPKRDLSKTVKSNFGKVVKNIVLENEKCGYNPEKDMNWNKLRDFLQRECIRRMDVKTKIRLSQTCKFEQRRIDQEKLKLEYIAENIASITEKSDYNPKKDMNWDILPMEMRDECVKRMDFKTRCCFRGVSKTERALIDSEKYRFKLLYLIFNGHIAEITAVRNAKESEREIQPIPKRITDYGLISAILKHAEVKTFILHGFNYSDTAMKPVLEEIIKLGPFRFEALVVYGNPFIYLLMKNCENLKKVEFNGFSYRFPYKEILELPSTMKVNEFKFKWMKAEDFLKFLMGLAQKWIDNDVEVGKSVQFQIETRGVIDKFAEKFTDRIIEKTDKIVRIRMNSETKQILLRLIGCKYEEDDDVLHFCSCKVIPIDSPESEYKNGDEWIQKEFDEFDE